MVHQPDEKQDNSRSDPFFAPVYDSEWNACIGRQGEEEDYVDGYMEAALELVSAVIDKKQYVRRDTLAMPILYNARHAIELTLKFVGSRLLRCGVLNSPVRRDHDIVAHWNVLNEARHGDSDLQCAIAALKPFVDSLHAVDEDGQQLRYPETQSGAKSLQGNAICNLALIQQSLRNLERVLVVLKDRAIDLDEDRRRGVFISSVSRRDLYRIARMLPVRSEWGSEKFAVAKSKVMSDFALSSRRFSDALDVIQKHRQMGGSLGMEFPLAHLGGDELMLVVAEWSKLFHREDADQGPQVFVWRRDQKILGANSKARTAAVKSICDTLSISKIADLQTIFSIGRDGKHGYCEEYEKRLDVSVRMLQVETATTSIRNLLSNPNLVRHLVSGLETLGSVRLADEVRICHNNRPEKS